MANVIEKSNPQRGVINSVSVGVAPYLAADYYIVSDHPSAGTKWPDFTVLSTASIPASDSKYWKDSGSAIADKSQSEKDNIDTAEASKTSKAAAKEVRMEAYDTDSMTTVSQVAGVVKDLLSDRGIN